MYTKKDSVKLNFQRLGIGLLTVFWLYIYIWYVIKCMHCLNGIKLIKTYTARIQGYDVNNYAKPQTRNVEKTG